MVLSYGVNQGLGWFGIGAVLAELYAKCLKGHLSYTLGRELKVV